MAKVPNTTTFTLQDVCNVVLGNPTTLQECVNNAITSWYDGTYYTAPATSLYEFRNYGKTGVGINLGYNSFNPTTACSASTTYRYTDTGDLNTSNVIWTNAAGTSKAATGYYSNGSIARFWNSTAETLGSASSC